MREYKMRRGEHLEDRVEDMEAFIEDYFGTITGQEEYNSNELHVIEDPDNPVFDRVVAGKIEYSSKKDKLALDIEEHPAEEVIAEGHVDAAEEAVSLKNEFLKEATGRDAKARRDSLKRSVEDDAETPDNV
jgi:carboxypeptidase C (cathepsin A)